jgi:hypothetical protein
MYSLTFALDGVNGKFQALAATPGERAPMCLLDMRLGEPRSQSGCCGEGNNLFPLPGIEPQFFSC